MEYNIPNVGKACCVTGREFQAGEVCWSILVMDGGLPVRRDYSEEGWTGMPEGAIGCWQSRIAEKATTTKQLADPDSLLEYFTSLLESHNKTDLRFAYVLALLLVRKKRLILDDTVDENGVNVMRLSGRGGEGPFSVPEQELTQAEIAELEELLDGRLMRTAA